MVRIAFAALAASLAMAACYSVPQPACGFFCGSGGACPDDYTCQTSDNRCHLNGSAPQMCSPGVDAGIADTTDDVPGDVPIDGNVAPTIVGNTPATGAAGVSVASNVTATFSEEVFGVVTSTFTLKQGAASVASVVTYMTGSHIATLDPVEQLVANTTYTATLTAGIGDAEGLPIPATSFSFTTGTDMVGPSVTLVTPAQNDTNVPVIATVTARFDEPVLGISGTTFTLKNGATTITGTTTYTAATRTARFTPDTQLPANTLLTAALTAGITDNAANGLAAAPVNWTFTSDADLFAPRLQSTVPASGAAGIAVGSTVTVVFDEPLVNVDLTSFTVAAGSAVTGTLASSMGGRAWTFTPTAALPAATLVTVTLSTAIKDAAGNALAAPVTFTFTTQ